MNSTTETVRQTRPHGPRKGAIAVFAAIVLSVMFAFVAFAVDTGLITLSQTNMQNAADAAALAAAQEIVAAIQDEESGANIDLNSIAVAQAREVAAAVAAANGIYVNPDQDVSFGKRTFDDASGTWSIDWGVEPFNVVKVLARRDQADTSLPDGRVKLSFGWAVGMESVELTSAASAFIEARDAVVVLDFSGSMNDDSELKSINKLAQTEIEDNLEQIFAALGPVDVGSMTFEPQWLTVVGPPPAEGQGQVTVTFKDTLVDVVSTEEISKVKLQFTNGQTQTFLNLSGTSGEFGGTGWHYNKPIKTVWVTSNSSEGVTVVGAPPEANNQPQIQVTFFGTSINVESTKDLSNVVLEYEDGVHQKFDGLSGYTGTFAGTGGNVGKFITNCWIKSGANSSGEGPGYGERFENPIPPDIGEGQRFDDTNANVKLCFGLDQVPYPYDSGSWNDFINYVRGDSDIRNAGYRKKYGGMTWVNYMLEKKNHHHQTSDLWKTPHYPFHAVKNGLTLFIDFLSDLDFGDEVGLVSYDDEARIESYLADDGVVVDLGNNLITNDYDAVDTIQRHKQAGHYGTYTGMGYGVKEARTLLVGDPANNVDGHMRYGARPTMILMTDGQANRYPGGWSLPNGFDWDDWTDYDGDGNADYTTGNKAKQYAFWEATETFKLGVTIHTMSVGAGADRDLMKAIAFAGRGVWMDIPGGATVAEMQTQLLDAFRQVAANVPPPKLVYDN